MDSTSGSFRKQAKGKLITKSASKDNLCSFEDITSIDFLSSDYEYDFEQTCLLKLKQQREKIEELTKLYERKEQEVEDLHSKGSAMKSELQRLEELSQVVTEHQDLKKNHEQVVKKMSLMEIESKSLKFQLQELLKCSSEQISKLKAELRLVREKQMLSSENWQAQLQSKEENIRNLSRLLQEKQCEIDERSNQWKVEIDEMKEELQEKQATIEEQKEWHYKEVMTREEAIANLDKLIEGEKKDVKECRAKMVEMNDCYEHEKAEMLEVIDQLKWQVKTLKKDQSEKENSLYEFKQVLKKCDTKNQSLESTVLSLKTNLKKFKTNSDCSMKKVSQEFELQRGKYELFIDEMKSELQKQMEAREGLQLENKRMKATLEKRDQQQRQRKLMLVNEFRELDKLDQAVKRIL